MLDHGHRIPTGTSVTKVTMTSADPSAGAWDNATGTPRYLGEPAGFVLVGGETIEIEAEAPTPMLRRY